MMHAKVILWGATIAIGLAQGAAMAAVDSGEFTYQGQLKLDGVPVDDTCDFAFSLCSDPVDIQPADQVGDTLIFDGLDPELPPIAVSQGLFKVVLDFGPEVFNDDPRWLEVAVRCPSGEGDYTALLPRERIAGVPHAVHTRGISVDDEGFVGLGATRPAAPLHVVGTGNFRGNHVAYFESQSGPSSDGIAIQLDRASTNRGNNFLTFYNGNAVVTGRIEGFDLENGDWIAPPPLPDVGITFDPAVTYNPDWFDPGSLPTANFDPGELPDVSFSPGQLPTANFNVGRLPSLSFSGGSLPSASFNPGSLPNVQFNDGSLPSSSANYCNVLGINVLCGFSWSAGSTPSIDFEDGSLPSFSFSPGQLPSANFDRGALPSLTFSGGQLPNLSFDDGEFPSLVFSGGSLPSVESPPITLGEPTLAFDLPTEEELEALMCWAFESGASEFATLDPVSLAVTNLKQTVAQRCKDEGVTYGSKGADYAEWLPKLEPSDRFQIGQIVGVHAGRVSLDTEGAEQVMAISRAPVVVGNVPPEDEKSNYVTVGFMGQLPVVVRGRVQAGDYVIPSGYEDGTGVAISPQKLRVEHMGRVVGRAWTESDNDVYSLITVAIGLDHYEAKTILARQQETIEAQSARLDALAAENAALRDRLDALDAMLAALTADRRVAGAHGGR